MKIEYKILWIEDNLDEIQSLIENLKYKLENLGFTLKVDKKITLSGTDLTELNHRLSIYNPYDIIIFDYDLGATKGDDIAHNLRSKIYTDMIFYSGKEGVKLRKILFDKNIEGVYTVDRSNFIDNAWPIIEDQIKRICDINNMRGVLLDEMSKIDLVLRNILQKKYNDLDASKQEKQLNRFKKKLTKKKKNIEKVISKTVRENFSEVIVDPTVMEFNQVRCRLKSITRSILFDDESDLKEKQDLRNIFAHNEALYDDEEGSVSLLNNKYSFDDFTNMRKELIELSDRISKEK